MSQIKGPIPLQATKKGTILMEDRPLKYFAPLVPF